MKYTEIAGLYHKPPLLLLHSFPVKPQSHQKNIHLCDLQDYFLPGRQKKKPKQPTALLTHLFSLLEKRSMWYYYFSGDAFVSITSNVAGCSFLERRQLSARQISLSDKGFPSHMFQENTAINQWPQRSLGCVAEFSVET